MTDPKLFLLEDVGMRYCIILVALTLSFLPGCTHLALERRTVNQASTTTDLQYRQVLDNIAMFSCNPNTLPWHLNLQTASVQVSDQGTGTFLESIIGIRSPYSLTLTPSLNAQRGVLNQWGGVPTIDSEPLDLLVLAYQKALDPQDQDGQLRKKIFGKIGEVAVHYNLVLTKETLDKAIVSSGLEESKQWQLKNKNEDLHDQLDKVFAQVAQLSRPITDVQVDNYAQRLGNKVTEESRGEARAKLQAQQAQQSAQVQSTRIGVEDQIVRMTRDLCSLAYIPRYPATGRGEHNSQTIAQAQRKITSLLKLAESPQFQEPWVYQACNRLDLAKCGDYVGHHDKHGCHRSVYVPPAQLGTLRDFTLIVLDLSPIEIQDTSSGSSTGTVTYSPVIGTRP
jgi:hypothetical protein